MNLDDQIVRIQKSTRTTFSRFLPIHNAICGLSYGGIKLLIERDNNENTN
jgi:hypothetical protein